MINRIALLFFFGIALLTQPLRADPPAGAVFLEGEENRYALILCHGRGKHPTWKVVNPLRQGVHTRLGWRTLSLQMPAEDKDWQSYADDFPEAFETIKQAITFLRKEKGVTTIYLMGHSMGSRMASAFVADNPEVPIKGLIVAGIRNSGGRPLDGMRNLQDVHIPVLDIWGGDNRKDADAAREREALVSASYTQVEIPGSNHKFDGDEDEFVSAVIAWLKAQH